MINNIIVSDGGHIVSVLVIITLVLIASVIFSYLIINKPTIEKQKDIL